MSHWIVIPYLDCLELTRAAITDALAQDIGDVRVLAVAQGYEARTREAMETWALDEPRLFNWFFDPPLLSLSAVWNRALRMVWETGATEALVLNNDARYPAWLYSALVRAQRETGGLFVSGVNNPEGFDAQRHCEDFSSRGGPDFSCFLLTKAGHEKYPFDENFIPAYTEDVDTARRYQLGGDGKKIFSIDLPYKHFGSGTLNSLSPEKRAALERRIDAGSRAYYQRKWGGPVNAERWNVPFGGEAPRDGACTTTPDLEAHGCAGSHPDGGTQQSPDAAADADR